MMGRKTTARKPPAKVSRLHTAPSPSCGTYRTCLYVVSTRGRGVDLRVAASFRPRLSFKTARRTRATFVRARERVCGTRNGIYVCVCVWCSASAARRRAEGWLLLTFRPKSFGGWCDRGRGVAVWRWSVMVVVVAVIRGAEGGQSRVPIPHRPMAGSRGVWPCPADPSAGGP